MATWEDFCEAVLTTGVQARTASDQVLDAYEARVGFPLPARYREFASTFGAGQLTYRKGRRKPSFLISVPGRFSRPRSYHYDIDAWNQEMREAQKPGARPGRARRLVVFAKDLSKNYYGWGPEEVTRPETHDYAIYRRRLGAAAAKRVASTFEEFLVDFCVGEPLAAWKEAGGPPDQEVPDEEEWDEESRIRFHPNFSVSDFPGNDDEEDDEDDEDEGQERVEVIHRLIIPPTRFGPDEEGLLWNEVLPDGGAEVRFWIPDDDADRDRLEAFWEACQQVDWDDVRIHEIASTEIKRRAFAMPVPAPPPAPKEGPPPEFTEQGLIRRVPHDPAPVAESWRRIEAWMSRNCPEVVVALLPGASEKDIAKFEEAIGQKLPEDVRASYRIHDGRGGIPLEYEKKVRGGYDAPRPSFVRAVFYDYGLDSIRDGRGRQPILHMWKHWAGFADEQGEDPEPDSSYGKFESFPAGAIKLRYACRGWIPLYDCHSNHFGVDLDPGPTGVRSQVINFGRDQEHKFVLATSWAQFLEDYADELEAGNFVIKGEPGDGERYLWMARPKESLLCWNWRNWAEAKLDPAFQAVRPVPPPDPVPADPETDRECRAVVDGFLAEFDAWERRWLAVRPVDELGFNSIGEREDGDFTGGFSLDHFAEQGLPIPPAIQFMRSKARDNPVKFAKFLKTTLKFGEFYEPAMAERRTIFARFASVWAREHQGTTFWLTATPRYDLQADRVAEVLRRDDDTAFVVMAARGGWTYRFLLKREEGAWRIERLQWSYDGGPFSTRSI